MIACYIANKPQGISGHTLCTRCGIVFDTVNQYLEHKCEGNDVD